MKIALAQLNYHVGDFENNSRKIIETILQAKNQQAELVVFSELSVSGYPPLDFLNFKDFTDKCLGAVYEIAKHCVNIAAIVGAPSHNPQLEGKNLYNSAFFLLNGKVDKIIHKTLLPTYDVFDEYRYFEPNKKFEIIEYNNRKIALTICEDLWNVEDDPLYTFCPLDNLIKQNPELVINIAASPFNYKHEQERKTILARNCNRYQLPVFYVNHVGAQTELIFDGGSLVMNKKGEVLHELNSFSEDFRIINFPFEEPTSPAKPGMERGKSELIQNALILGIQDYFRKMNFKKAVLGLSGGIDSAVVLALAVRALGKENVLPVLMPSHFSSEHSVSDSVEICRNLAVDFEKISIEKIFDEFTSHLHPLFGNLPFNVTEENLQARIRGILLMAISNKFGNILLNTSNKSELAVGYGTLYGDMCGGLSVIGDLYKTDVYELAEFINVEKEIIPRNIITKPPSAELRPGQKDSDSLPDYSILDKILYHYIEEFCSPQQIINEGFEKSPVERVLKLVNTNEYKRKQFAPILRISPKAFGLGRRMPIVGKYLS